MPPIRSTATIVEKYKRVTPGKSKEYAEGVKDPKKKWIEETPKAAAAFAEGVTDAIARDAFAKGVLACGQAGYLDPALKKGEARYRPGVEYGVTKYNKNFAPMRDVIAGIDLPPRGPKGDPRNIDRVATIATALHAAKVGKL